MAALVEAHFNPSLLKQATQIVTTTVSRWSASASAMFKALLRKGTASSHANSEL
jgi:hypothetical protein